MIISIDDFKEDKCIDSIKNFLDCFKEKSLEMLTLGDLILRAETAVVVALGNIIYEYSNFNK